MPVAKGYVQTPEHRANRSAALIKPMPKFKVCPRCNRRRRASSFKVRANGRTLHSYCIPCERTFTNERQRRYWAAHPERRDIQREQNRVAQFKRKYEMTLDDYNALLEAQGGGCAICGASEPGAGRKHLYVDHCHNSNAVRGLLCSPCNLGLGSFADRTDRLARAIEYLNAAG